MPTGLKGRGKLEVHTSRCTTAEWPPHSFATALCSKHTRARQSPPHSCTRVIEGTSGVCQSDRLVAEAPRTLGSWQRVDRDHSQYHTAGEVPKHCCPFGGPSWNDSFRSGTFRPAAQPNS